MFNTDLEGKFQIFSISHFIAILIVFTIVVVIYYFKDVLREKRYFDKIRWTLAILILLQELSLNIVRIVQGEWMLGTSLPFHLCGLAVLMSAIVLITQNKRVFLYSFFVMMIGAALALLTPGIEKQVGFPHYRFIQYFISHGLIVINFTFILFVMGYVDDVKYRHLVNNFLSLISIAIIALGFNLLVNGNYLYLLHKPEGETAFDLFGVWPWYLINIFIIGIPIFFHIFYLPFFIRNWMIKKKQLSVV